MTPLWRCCFFFEHILPDQLLFPPIDDLSLRGNRLTFDALSRFLTEPMRRLNDPSSPSGIKLLKSADPDLIVSIRYGRILRQSAIDIPHLGVLNLHSGKLPQYRGVMATFRALLAGDAKLFSTLHWIDDETIDTGRIISIQGVPTEPRGCYLSNTLNLYPGRCGALLGAINTLHTQEGVEAVAPSSPGDYFTFPDRDALARFHRAGHRLVDPALLAPILSSYYPG
jgi:methionyl-tRNA formyltransferase